jgi:hypothetical protein
MDNINSSPFFLLVEFGQRELLAGDWRMREKRCLGVYSFSNYHCRVQLQG